jgi:hypothetical protein
MRSGAADFDIDSGGKDRFVLRVFE